MAYSCISATREGARCRNTVKDGETRCVSHPESPEAPPPDVILIKFNINPRWSQKFQESGIPRKSLLSLDKEGEHVQHAEKFGRDPYHYRQIADSGVPVFGPEGLKDVSIFEMFKDLLEKEGYNIVDIHLRPRRDEKMDTLIITLSKEGEEAAALSSSATMGLLDFLAVSCWGHCHIWANPPDNRKVLHTVNSSHRLADARPRLILQFNHGLWAVKSI